MKFFMVDEHILMRGKDITGAAALARVRAVEITYPEAFAWIHGEDIEPTVRARLTKEPQNG